MSTKQQLLHVPAAGTWDDSGEVDRYIDRYRPTVLSDEQWVRFGPRMRELVRLVPPRSQVEARTMLGAIARVLAETDRGDSSVDQLLSAANVAAWSHLPATKATDDRSVANMLGRVAQVQRAARGLPGRIRPRGPKRIHPIGYGADELLALAEVAKKAGASAARGFAVAFGLGSVDVISGSFVVENGGWWFVHPDGGRDPVMAVVEEVFDCWGDGCVRLDDVTAFRYAVKAAGLSLRVHTIRQTHWSLALELPLPVGAAMATYGIPVGAVASCVSEVAELVPLDDSLVERLRGPVGAACVVASTAHARARPPKSGVSEERRTMRNGKTSKAEAKRRAAQFRDKAEASPAPLPDALRRHIDGYAPEELATETWAAVRPTFMDAMARGGLSGVESFKKHRVVVAGFLGWLHEQHRSIDIASAFCFDTIDAYYLQGLKNLEDATRSDYRSRLRNLAKRLNPGLDSPIAASVGHVSVRPGYSVVEEAAIRRVALRQRTGELRRRTCIAVGLSGGGGLDAVDIRHLRCDAIDDRGVDGIVVQVTGPRARTVVIRRDYEEVVRVGLEGLKPNELVMRNTARTKVNPVGRALEDTKTFDDCPHIEVARLRSTWLTWLLSQPVPLRIVLQVAGLGSARSITDLLPHLPTFDHDLVWLRDGSPS